MKCDVECFNDYHMDLLTQELWEKTNRDQSVLSRFYRDIMTALSGNSNEPFEYFKACVSIDELQKAREKINNKTIDEVWNSI